MPHRFFNPFPKYLQIREILVSRIRREMKPGERLATEFGLCKEFGVSRETIREALSGLETDGLISRRRRRGTFVEKMPPGSVETRLTGLSEDLSDLKLDTEARLLTKGTAVPPPEVAAALRLEPGGKVYRLTRLRLFEREPLEHTEVFLPLELGARIAKRDLHRTGLIPFIRKGLKIPVWEDNQRVEAHAAEPEVARRLKIPIGAPVLRITRILLVGEGRPIAYFRSHYRSDRYFYTIKLEAPTPRSRRRGVSRA